MHHPTLWNHASLSHFLYQTGDAAAEIMPWPREFVRSFLSIMQYIGGEENSKPVWFDVDDDTISPTHELDSSHVSGIKPFQSCINLIRTGELNTAKDLFCLISTPSDDMLVAKFDSNNKSLVLFGVDIGDKGSDTESSDTESSDTPTNECVLTEQQKLRIEILFRMFGFWKEDGRVSTGECAVWSDVVVRSSGNDHAIKWDIEILPDPYRDLPSTLGTSLCSYVLHNFKFHPHDGSECWKRSSMVCLALQWMDILKDDPYCEFEKPISYSNLERIPSHIMSLWEQSKEKAKEKLESLIDFQHEMDIPLLHEPYEKKSEDRSSALIVQDPPVKSSPSDVPRDDDGLPAPIIRDVPKIVFESMESTWVSKRVGQHPAEKRLEDNPIKPPPVHEKPDPLHYSDAIQAVFSAMKWHDTPPTFCSPDQEAEIMSDLLKITVCLRPGFRPVTPASAPSLRFHLALRRMERMGMTSEDFNNKLSFLISDSTESVEIFSGTLEHYFWKDLEPNQQHYWLRLHCRLGDAVGRIYQFPTDANTERVASHLHRNMARAADKSFHISVVSCNESGYVQRTVFEEPVPGANIEKLATIYLPKPPALVAEPNDAGDWKKSPAGGANENDEILPSAKRDRGEEPSDEPHKKRQKKEKKVKKEKKSSKKKKKKQKKAKE